MPGQGMLLLHLASLEEGLARRNQQDWIATGVLVVSLASKGGLTDSSCERSPVLGQFAEDQNPHLTAPSLSPGFPMVPLSETHTFLQPRYQGSKAKGCHHEITTQCHSTTPRGMKRPRLDAEIGKCCASLISPLNTLRGRQQRPCITSESSHPNWAGLFSASMLSSASSSPKTNAPWSASLCRCHEEFSRTKRSARRPLTKVLFMPRECAATSPDK